MLKKFFTKRNFLLPLLVLTFFFIGSGIAHADEYIVYDIDNLPNTTQYPGCSCSYDTSFYDYSSPTSKNGDIQAQWENLQGTYDWMKTTYVHNMLDIKAFLYDSRATDQDVHYSFNAPAGKISIGYINQDTAPAGYNTIGSLFYNINAYLDIRMESSAYVPGTAGADLIEFAIN